MATLPELLAGCARSYRDKPAYVAGEERLTWGELDAAAHRLAAGMANAGCRQGERSAILSSDRLEIIVHWYACSIGGFVRVGVNPRYSQVEIAHILTDSGATSIFVERQYLMLVEAWKTATPDGLIVLIDGESGDRSSYVTLLQCEDRASGPLDRDGSRPLAIAYTSGTTGAPKGAVWTHDGFIQGLRSLLLNVGLSPDDIYANPLPLTGAILFATMNIANGMTVVLTDHGFAANTFLDTLERERVTCTMMPPVMLEAILDEQAREPRQMSQLRLLAYGSTIANMRAVEGLRRLFDCATQQWYGSTEMTEIVAILRDGDHRRAMSSRPELLSSCGRPVPSTTIQIRGSEGQLLPPGDVGEIYIKPSASFGGYFLKPLETARATDGCWFRPGDVGMIDEEGYLFVIERTSLVIRQGCRDLYPTRIERIVGHYAAVREAAVIPVDDSGTPAICLLLNVASNDDFDLAGFGEFAAEQLEPWERPAFVKLVPALPRGVTGKLDRRSLAAFALQHREAIPLPT